MALGRAGNLEEASQRVRALLDKDLCCCDEQFLRSEPRDDGQPALDCRCSTLCGQFKPRLLRFIESGARARLQ